MKIVVGFYIWKNVNKLQYIYFDSINNPCYDINPLKNNLILRVSRMIACTKPQGCT